MTLEEATKIAAGLNGESVVEDYRNLWRFFPMSDDQNAVCISKPEAKVKKPGVYVQDLNEGWLREVNSKEAVLYADVFGTPFYDNDPPLPPDELADSDMEPWDKVQVALDRTLKLIDALHLYSGVRTLLFDLQLEGPEVLYKRLRTLNHHLERVDSITAQEFQYLHQDLYFLHG